MCDHRLQCMHSCSACSMHEGRGYRYTFQRVRVASSPEVPKVTWWKIATFLGYHLHWLTSLETSRHFRKIALRLGIFLAMFRECLCVVARQLAPKCRDFSNVAKLARQCKWPHCGGSIKEIVELWCLCSIMMLRRVNKQPGKQKFWNRCSHYQEIYDWISPLNKRSGSPFILTQ